jgi:DNA-binding transcriptional ArsR family regulator
MVEYSSRGLDATYRALAHPVRRGMVERLRAGDAGVTGLAAGFEISLAAASKHIKVLEAAGLVRRTISGREHHLALDVDPLSEAADWIARSTGFWSGRLDVLEALLRDRDPS